MLKILKSSLIVVVLLTGCNTIEAHSIDKTKEKKVLITTEVLDPNDKVLQKELKAFYERFFSDKLKKALASSQNLDNPTFTPLIEAFPFAIRSTNSYKKIEQNFKENGYRIKDEIDFEKFYISSSKEGYKFNFTPIPLIPILLKEGENIPNYSECAEVIDVKLGYYFTKRKLFVRDNECITSTDSILLNSETNKSIELDGFATGIQRFTLYDKEILQVNSHMGAHANAVFFFFIEKDGDLVLVKNGFMASDIGDPSVNISSMNNTIEVKTYYSKEKFVNNKPCRSLVEDSFRYDYKKREFMKIDSKVTMSECEDE